MTPEDFDRKSKQTRLFGYTYTARPLLGQLPLPASGGLSAVLDAHDALTGRGRTPTKPRSLMAVPLSTSERAAAGPGAGVTGPDQPGQRAQERRPPPTAGRGGPVTYPHGARSSSAT